MASDRKLIGKKYPTVWRAIGRAQALAYAAATDDGNAAKTRYVPPMAVVTLSIPFGVAQIAQDQELIGDLSRLFRVLHTEEELLWHRPIACDEELEVAATIIGIDERSSGEILRLCTSIKNRQGLVLADVKTTLLIRERNPHAPRFEETPMALVRDVQRETQWQVAEDQSERYAAASGDHNPIHLDDAIARQVNLKRRILHGLCTASFAQRVLVESYANGDSSRLRRLHVRFCRPVYMGDLLTCGCESQPQGEIAFFIKNQEGQTVLLGVGEVN